MRTMMPVAILLLAMPAAAQQGDRQPKEVDALKAESYEAMKIICDGARSRGQPDPIMAETGMLNLDTELRACEFVRQHDAAAATRR